MFSHDTAGGTMRICWHKISKPMQCQHKVNNGGTKKKKNLPGKKLTKHYCGPTWKNSSTKYSTTGKTSGHQGSGWPAQNATADDWQKMAFDITTSLVMDRSFTTKVYQQAGMERIILRSWGVRSVPVEKTRNFLDKKKKDVNHYVKALRRPNKRIFTK